MKIETLVVLIGCVLAVLAVQATDRYFAPPPNTTFACRTDMECQDEEAAHARGERCLIIEDVLVCLPGKRRLS